jgi:ribonucleotide reductase beta subunit family protein with ferritin-like domain
VPLITCTTESLILWLLWYKMTVAVDREKRNDVNTKLTRVSTKLSIEYYNELQTITNRAYRNKGINKPTISEFLRFMIDHTVDEIRNNPRFSEQQLK